MTRRQPASKSAGRLAAMLAPKLNGYEPRAEQERMAEAVGAALAHNHKLIVEAGTGTGKSLAYLIPLAEYAIANEKRAVVSTFTKALQRQLVEKDLPFVRDNLIEGLRFALCLGSENYLCIRRLNHTKTLDLFDAESGEIVKLLTWAGNTSHGIRESTPHNLWSKVSREADFCHGKSCRHFLTCFWQRARELQRRSHVLVVNHHLYFANLASGKYVLPEYSAAVFDEAHELEEVAADYLGAEISNFRLSHVLGALMNQRGRGLVTRLKWLDHNIAKDLMTLVETVRMVGDAFFGALKSRIEGQSIRIKEPRFMEDTLSEPLVKLGMELDGLAKASPDEEDARDLRAVSLRALAAAEDTRAVLDQSLEGYVYWAERSGRNTRLVGTPIDVAGLHVFDDLEAAVFTSATLAAGGKFDYIKGRLGIGVADELLLASHFDYRAQAALYIAMDLPAPNTPAFEAALTRRVREILERMKGRTLVLFTSYSLMHHAADSISIKGLEILRQGDDESYNLIRKFRSTPHAALFGTYTFWQGIDIPGDDLQCVVITRLPFAVPDEPVMEARMEHLESMGLDPFRKYQLPRAALILKQGFGRLIRTSTDRGVVAILDSRIKTKPYGKTFLRSLPDVEIVESLDALRLPER